MFIQVSMDHKQLGKLFSVESTGFKHCNDVNDIRTQTMIRALYPKELHDSYY